MTRERRMKPRRDDVTMGYDTNARGYDTAKGGMTQRRRV